MAEPIEIMRHRLRRDSLKIDKEEITERIKTFFKNDGHARDIDREARLQRYAKYRMWTEPKEWPWPEASNVTLSDMTEKSLRLQDTLNNAVMAQRPAVNANAIHKANKEREPIVDSLLDYQFFVEQPGEHIVGEIADAFINDGEFVAFVPWVKEKRKISTVLTYPAIPEGMIPSDYFEGLLETDYREAIVTPMGDRDQPWDFRVEKSDEDDEGNGREKRLEVSFYTRDDGRVDAVVKGEQIIYDGPRVMIMDFDDVYHPPRAANLQPPGPSNPGGAQHVILRSFPTVDEIRRLRAQGFYDLLSKEDADALDQHSRRGGSDDDAEETQRDDLAGESEDSTVIEGARSQNTLTRLVCFDRYDIDGDGLDEDVIWWYLLEPNVLLKAKVLQEMYPLRVDRPRPLAEASLFPVRGRRKGFSMLELMEGLHDAMKKTLDQTFDANDIGIIPFWFYRPTSSMNNEILSLGPGDGFPLSDPQRDVHFPQIGNPQAQGMALNLFTLLQQAEERVTVVGDMQLGRVPAGKSSALRTVGGMSLLAGQGEARPERILRRYFTGIAQIFSIMHDLNEHFLPKKKEFRIVGGLKTGQDPYMNVRDRSLIAGPFVFDFQANVFNTSKQQLQMALERMMATFVNGLAIQLGISTPETIYNLMRDFGKTFGVDPEAKRYINPPRPGVAGPKILAEEAIMLILQDQLPDGEALESGGWIEHLQRLIEIEGRLVDEKDDTGEITPHQAELLQQWKLIAQSRAAQQQEQMRMQQAANQMAQQVSQGNPGGRPPEQVPPDVNSNPQVSGGAELFDESLPGAGGGGQ